MDTKTCIKCKEEKPLEEFYKRSDLPGSRRSKCKVCETLYRKEYRDAHLEIIRERDRAYRKANSDKANAIEACRRASKLQATPKRANKEYIALFYTLAKEAEIDAGTKIHVDHIVPLLGGIVCGLHNEFNLQLLPASENCSKNNRYWPDMPD